MAVRRIELARAAWGASLLFAPRWTLESVHRIAVDRKSLLIARVLGARQLTQAVLSGVDPTPEILAMGVWVDLTHATSALGLAAMDRDRAAAGITDTAVAAAWAGFGWHDLRAGSDPAPGHDRRRDSMARWVLAHVPGGEPLSRAAHSRREKGGGMPNFVGELTLANAIARQGVFFLWPDHATQ